MKLKLPCSLLIITALGGAGPLMSAPTAPVPAVLAEQASAATERNGSSSTPFPAEGQSMLSADKAALLQARERGKQQAARAAFDLAELSAGDNDQGRAAELLREAVALQPENTDYLIVASRLAFKLKDYSYAEACLVKVIAIYRGTLSGDDTKLFEAFDNLATLHRIQGRAAAAKSVLTEALAVTTALYGEDHPRVIHNLYRLAELELISANYGEAKVHLERAMGVMDASPSPIDDRDGAALLHNIGELYRVSGQYTEAERAYRKALALWLKSPETNQRGVAMTQASLDRLRTDQNRPSARADLNTAPQVKSVPPVSSLTFGSTRAVM
jgi:tetratricopeptide (TPR) repeat protein